MIAALAAGGCGSSDKDTKRPQGNATPPPPGETQTATHAKPPPKQDDERRATSDERPATSTPAPARVDPTVTRAAFARQADAACRRFRKRLLRLRPSQTGADQQLDFFTTMARLMDRSTREIRRLERPPAEAATIDRYVKSLSRTAQLLRRLRRAVERKDERAVKRISEGLQRNAITSNRLTKRLGFKVCGSGLSPVGPT